MVQVTALALFSGGLDSILACKVVAAQGINVIALKFVSPFFDHDLLERREEYARQTLDKYGFRAEVVDISEEYVQMLRHPAHGYGKHFNPCIDCKILMMRKARELMNHYGASFLVSGEVIGQRPMSQRRDTLRVIERDSGCEGLLLRPLCAQLLEPTRAELDGLVDRERLHRFSGRGRKEQKQLAAAFGVTDYPGPGGGCMLTDANLSERIRRVYHGLFSFGANHAAWVIADMRMLSIGRQFQLDSDVWFILGRDERENNQLEQLRGPGDWLVRMDVRPGPLGLLRHAREILAGTPREQEMLRRAAGLVVHYGKKVPEEPPGALVMIDKGADTIFAEYGPLTDEAIIAGWRI